MQVGRSAFTTPSRTFNIVHVHSTAARRAAAGGPAVRPMGARVVVADFAMARRKSRRGGVKHSLVFADLGTWYLTKAQSTKQEAARRSSTSGHPTPLVRLCLTTRVSKSHSLRSGLALARVLAPRVACRSCRARALAVEHEGVRRAPLRDLARLAGPGRRLACKCERSCECK